MRILMAALVVACTQTSCNYGYEKAYTLHMKDGKTTEVCGFNSDWEYPDCLVLKDAEGNPRTRICGVDKFEFGLPTPPPPAEAPRQ